MPQQVQQIIQDRYIDQKQLQALLARNFAAGTYTMKVSLAKLFDLSYQRICLQHGSGE